MYTTLLFSVLEGLPVKEVPRTNLIVFHNLDLLTKSRQEKQLFASLSTVDKAELEYITTAQQMTSTNTKYFFAYNTIHLNSNYQYVSFVVCSSLLLSV